jgi:hypothetical protein
MRRLLTFGCLCLLAMPRTAAAEWHLAPTIGLTFAANTSLVDPDRSTAKIHPNLGGAVTLLGSGLFGAEALVVVTPGFFKGDVGLVTSSRFYAVMGNIVLTAPRRWTEYNLRPFVSGGLGVLHASFEGQGEAFPVSENMLAFNIGGGAVGFFTPRTGVRFDLRYFSNLHRPNSDEDGLPIAIGRPHLRYMTFSVGLVLRR